MKRTTIMLTKTQDAYLHETREKKGLSKGAQIRVMINEAMGEQEGGNAD